MLAKGAASATIKPLAWLTAMIFVAVAGVFSAALLKHRLLETTAIFPHLPFPVVRSVSNERGAVFVGIAIATVVAIALLAIFFTRSSSAAGSRAPTLLFSGMLGVGVILAYFPVAISSDPYGYTAYGRLYALHRINPYQPLWAGNVNHPRVLLDPAVAADPIIQPSLQFFHGRLFSDNYGPLWTLAVSGVALLEQHLSLQSQFISQRIIALLAAASTAWGLFYLLRHVALRERCERLSTFMFHPLVLLETAIGGHNDIIMVALAVWAFGLVAEWPLLAGVLIAASISVKYLSLVLVPFLFLKAHQRDRRSAVMFLAATIAVLAATFVPFLTGGSPLRAIFGLANSVRFGSLFWIVSDYIPDPLRGYGIPLHGHHLHWHQIAQLVFAGTLITALIISWAQFRKKRNVENVWRATVALLWAMPVLYPWYLLWFAPALVQKDAWGRYASLFGIFVLADYLTSMSTVTRWASTTAFLLVFVVLVFPLIWLKVAARRPDTTLNPH